MKKSLRRAVSTLMIGIMAFCLLAAPAPMVTLAAKAKKPSLSPKKTTITVGKSKKITLKNAKKAKKTKWSAKPKKAVKLSGKKKKSVMVKGNREAKKVVLTAKFRIGKKKRTAKCTIAVRKRTVPNTPSPSSRVTVRPRPTAIINPTPIPTEEVTPAAGSPTPAAGSPTPAAGSPTPAAGSPTPAAGSPTPTSAITPTATPTPEPTPTSIMAQLTPPEDIEEQITPPDLLTTLKGEPVTKDTWGERREEIKGMLQYYMYGIWRDGEDVSATVSSNKMTITVKHPNDAAKSMSFTANIKLPATGTMPDGGWPVIISPGITPVGSQNEASYIDAQEYATITFTMGDIASYDGKSGGFYNLYPYEESWEEQTGLIMAWAWGFSKILDALETTQAGALNINKDFAIASGTTANGSAPLGGTAKAAACAGAFDERFKVTVAFNSGYGGLTMGRYHSPANPFNLMPEFENDPGKDNLTLDKWENNTPDVTWDEINKNYYNGNFAKFKSFEHLPVDAHFVAALSCMEGRYLFMSSNINGATNGSAPGLWYTYEKAKEAFELMELEDNLAIHYHLNSPSPVDIDLCKMFAYVNYHLKNKPVDISQFTERWVSLMEEWSLEDLKTCIFAHEDNAAVYAAGKMPQPDPTDIPTTDIPTTDIPTTDIPTTDIPTTDIPTTDIPTTDIPTTDIPTTDIPTTDIPTTDIPTTDVPTTDIPTTDAPISNITTMEQLDQIAPPGVITPNPVPPELLKMYNGTPVTKDTWEERREEIKGMLQYYVYGIWREGEEVSVANVTASSMSITVKNPETEKTMNFTPTISLPEGDAPAGGWPVIIVLNGSSANTAALAKMKSQGYATVTFTTSNMSSATSRTGGFYNLYPYGSTWKEQTGIIMAYAWGFSKILDALEKPETESLNIDTDLAIVSGTGIGAMAAGAGNIAKAAACAGAFDDRFKAAEVYNSGYFGLTMGRYRSPADTFDLTSEFENDPSKPASPQLNVWKNATADPTWATLASSSTTNYRYLYNDNLYKFKSFEQLPVDAHFLAALYCKEDKYLFMSSNINGTTYGSAPGLWYTYECAKEAYTLMELEDNLAIHYHLNSATTTEVDYTKMLAFTDYYLMDKQIDYDVFKEKWPFMENWTLADLKTCIFAHNDNKDAYEAGKAK